MNEVQRQAQKARESLRWRVLSATYHSKPVSLSDALALRICSDTGLDADIQIVREAFDYLEGKELVIVKRHAVAWLGRITDQGTDVVEGNVECPIGINRPDW
jgi:hypothetical protein